MEQGDRDVKVRSDPRPGNVTSEQAKSAQQNNLYIYHVPYINKDTVITLSMQRQTAVTAHSKSEQLLLFAFVSAPQRNSNCLLEK